MRKWKWSCFRVKKKLFNYALEKHLTQEERDQVKAHIDTCPKCKKDVEVYQFIIEGGRQYFKDHPAPHTYRKPSPPKGIRKIRFFRWLLAWLEFYRDVYKMQRQKIKLVIFIWLTLGLAGYVGWMHLANPANFLAIAGDGNLKLQIEGNRSSYCINAYGQEGTLLVAADKGTKVTIKTPSLEVEGEKASFFVEKDQSGYTDVGVTLAYDSVNLLTSKKEAKVPAGFKYSISPEGEVSKKVKMDEAEITTWNDKLMNYTLLRR